jgi:hypothetical protein
MLDSSVERNKYWKAEYFVPRFAADAAKQAGFNGILYTSNYHYFDNRVILDSSKIEYEFIGEPYVLLQKPKTMNAKEIHPLSVPQS